MSSTISSELHLIGRNDHGEGHAQGFKVFLAAADLVGFAGAELQEVLGGFRLSNEVKHLVVVLQDCPVRVVLADRRVDLEPARQLHEELNILALVKPLGEVPLDFRLVNDVFVHGIGSTAGAAALIGKSNGNPIKTIYVYSRPEWTALVVLKDSPIHTVRDLKGKKIAVTRGTDPHVFLLRSLYQVGLTEKDVEIVPLQHSDGRNALERGDVDAWAGLDPLMAQSEVEKGSKLFHRDASLNSYGVLNVREEFARSYPQYVQRVLAAYEKARLWAIQNPAEFHALYARTAKINDAVVTKVLERTDLSSSAIGDEQKKVITASGDVLKKSGVISGTTDVAAVVNDLIDPQYARQALASK